MYEQPVEVLTSGTSILQDGPETNTTTVPELFQDPIPKHLLAESPPSRLPKTVTMQLSTSTSTTIHQDLKLPHQLLVTRHGLVSPSSSPEKLSVKVEQSNLVHMMDTFPYSDDADKALMKIVSTDNKIPDNKRIDVSGGSTQNNESNDFDADINTIVITNDETGEIKMTFSDNAVGQYEEIEEKSDQKESEQSIGEEVGMCPFTTLLEKEDKVNGLSPTRKSDRSIKLNSAFGEEDGRKIPGFGRVLAAHMMKEAGSQSTKTGGKKTKVKRSRKQVDPKKTKLSVDDVYESEEGEGVESDGDLSKDLLKVRMLKCDSCGKHFLDKQKLQTHKKTHNKRKNSQSVSATSSHNNGSKKVYPCEVCGYTFRRREHWRRHRLTHLDTTPYKCPVCDRGFKRAEHVRRHQTVHTRIKAFDCNSCDKKFTRSEHLKKHMLLHLGKTPFARKKKSVADS
ncbi:zinc finger protein 809-like [Mizuhopecten yessoensis]|uniref:Zinc finger protein 648 n=1 Tax=Mizuhopecten yessoensis TaxID=6573 RepID=A0A210QFQ8_MIZYE|nr:zinc finger protein 809-like [Mizuhopecten yessoensis]OWF47584.1 Zinc finger protein 648 [Mizuhopecten yessoensis]